MSEPEESQEQTQHAPAEPGDWFLQFLTRHVNESNLEFGVTLQVGGMLVTGQLVPGAAYFDGFAEQFSTIFTDPKVAEEYRTALAGAGDLYRKPAADDAPPAQYVHLRDARFFNTKGDPIVERGVWWRGRISQVIGFTLGTLAVTTSSS